MAKNFTTLRTDLPNDVHAALAARAAAEGVPIGRFMRNLLVASHDNKIRKAGGTPPVRLASGAIASTGSSE
jgi:microcystin-dependent protein